MILTLSRRKLYRRLGFLTVLALLAVLTAAAGRGVLFTAARPPVDQPLTRANSPDDRVALTFDATYGRNELGRILSILEQHRVKATFFVGGSFLALHPEEVRMLAGKGHEVGTLGMKIIDLSTMEELQVTTALRDSQAVLEKVLGEPARFFRPPQGVASPSVVRGALAAQLTTVTYSLDSEDHKGLTSAQIAQRVVKNARRGDVILLSASDWSKETAKALPDLIRGLQSRGMKMVKVSELVPDDLRP